MRIDFAPSERTSLGVEWELQLVDLDTRRLSGVSDAVLVSISSDGNGEHPKAKHALFQSCVELITGICASAAQAKAELAATVAEVAVAAKDQNAGLLCSGTHPITDWATQRITDDDRYHALLERNQWLALPASSPYWIGSDTGRFDSQLDDGAPLPEPRPWLARENKWRAAGYGLDAEIVSDNSGTAQPVKEAIINIVDDLLPTAQRLHCDGRSV